MDGKVSLQLVKCKDRQAVCQKTVLLELSANVIVKQW
jgi:hypothetical protein